MPPIKIFLQADYLGNSGVNYLIFIISIILGLTLKGLISRYLSHSLYKVIGRKENNVGIEKFDALLTKPIAFLIMLSVLYFGFSHLSFPQEWNLANKNEFGIRMLLHRGFSLIYIYSVLKVFLRIVDYIGLILRKKAEETSNKMDDQLIPFVMEIIKFIIYVFAAFIILGNVLGINVTALITGLGIGGIALAMASKESLENLLGSFTIFLDRPFTVGDVVKVGAVTGLVEKVGFRSTRIKTFDKSIVTVPNKKMVDAELDNLGMRPVRRVKFYVGLTYSTTTEQIKDIVQEIQKMINDHPKTNDDGRVRFQEFGASSLDVLVLYYVNSPKWEDLIDTKEDINYKIMDIVKKYNSDFAFPSTSVYLQQNN